MDGSKDSGQQIASGAGKSGQKQEMSEEQIQQRVAIRYKQLNQEAQVLV